ncbi:hypothetical protein [Chryseobacterium binzhouense]|uniref:hypothetical protein n=1 Tax=Chryseobacterium binzhouense TaxID=2593646 RepID=UPI00117CC79B|nr:hypothetical protein [Chryseobacterium binzhouense]
MIKTKKKTKEKAIPIIEQTAKAVRLFSALKSLNAVRKVTKAINKNIADQKRFRISIFLLIYWNHHHFYDLNFQKS